MSELFKKLESIENLLRQQNILKKDVLSTKETAEYLGVSLQHLYRLMSEKQIPYYKCNGKIAAFNRVELDQWMLRNKQHTVDEIQSSAMNHKLKLRRG